MEAREKLGKAKQGDEKTSELERRASDLAERVEQLEVPDPRLSPTQAFAGKT